MASKSTTAREKAARVLCERQGLPENTKFEGHPMWESFLPEVDIVLAAVGGIPIHTIDDWLGSRRKGAPVTVGELLSLLCLLPTDEPVKVPAPDGSYRELITEMISVGEKSDRLYLDVPLVQSGQRHLQT